MNAKPLVLLAEDYPHVRRIVTHVMTQAGYDVIEASDGKQAVELAVERSPDLLVLDINLPQLSGIEALKQMRQHTSLTTTPALMLTGVTQREHIVEAAQAGAAEYLVKSEFKVQHFLDIVRGMLAEVVKASLSPDTAGSPPPARPEQPPPPTCCFFG